MPDRKIRGFFSGECDGELEDCAVCFGEIKVGERIIVLNCSDTAMHTYHERCIAMWLKDNETCPVCRANVL